MEYRIGRVDVKSEDLDIVLVNGFHALRARVEEFAAAVYGRVYGADLRTFSRELLVLMSRQKGILGCIGINTAESGGFFLERYLDDRVETELSKRLDMPVKREEVVEIGTLALSHRGFCRPMMAGLAGFLLARDKRFFVFTAVKTLRNTLTHLNVPFETIAEAKAENSGNKDEWGSYYEAMPEVIAVDMKKCLPSMERLIATAGSLPKGVSGATPRMVSLMNKLFLDGLIIENAYGRAEGF
ncbi:MAG TPA: thermostable hemolysin [Thermodesulfobacteriota bacterium]|nr:thermostable hemolysin [Thermodesulfobacteriota bacterium]